ncbi:EAL domain-containing protein [Asaia bogorensis]|uniref:EAL domain-containing protein n=1 Tax=Asaia bogorensis TaxID=91915 RepID=UPI0013C47804|nr:EAL domain-containing protein [Asaia bogorensis]
MPRDSSPIEESGVAVHDTAFLSDVALRGCALTVPSSVGATVEEVGLTTFLLSDLNMTEADRTGVRVSSVALSSIILPGLTQIDLSHPTGTPVSPVTIDLPGSGACQPDATSEGRMGVRSRRYCRQSGRYEQVTGAPDLRWTGRYGRVSDHITLIGWDVAPSGSQAIYRKPNDQRICPRADIAMLGELCRRMAPVGGHYRASLTLTDPASPDARFVQAMQEVFVETGFRPEALRLVLDERRFSLAGRDEALCLGELVDRGVELWVGRFGQGISSLALLREKANTGLITGVSLEAGLVSAPSGLWRLAQQGERHSEERLDPIASKFFSATCGALQALGIRTHFAHISSSTHYGFALAAGFDEMSGLCPELEGIAMEAKPPCA